ncbi:MAG: AMP-binding protein, partial [Cyclobacteriaceae bacterium]
DSIEFEQSTLESLRYFIVGGEVMPIPLIETWTKKGIPIRQGFGLTEVGPNIASLHQDDSIRKIGSIGTFNFYVEAKLMSLDGKKSNHGEEGELWLKGPMVSPGYWRNEEATQMAFEDGWFKTGDVLTCDEEGYYYVTDRIKNMFISGGENVYPAEVEKYLLELAGIKEVAVIGVPDEKWGETGKAYIVRKYLTLTKQDIIEFASRGLAKFKIPKHFEFVNDLPKNSSGKIDRLKLRNG